MGATLKERYDEAVKAANDRMASVKSAGKSMTDEDREFIQGKVAEAKSIQKDMDQIRADEGIAESLKGLGSPGDVDTSEKGTPGAPEVKNAMSLGDHFVKSVGEQISLLGMKGGRLSAPEYKAPATQQVSGWTAGVPILTEYDRTIVQERRERLTIADLCGSGTVSGNAISYFVEAGVQGGFATVAEGAAKPQISFDNPTTRVDALKKIAGWIEFTDEFIEDLAFLKSEIDTRLLYMLGVTEEAQILSGDGTGQNLLGIRNRSGVQVQAAPADEEGNADAIFQAMTKISTATSLTADALVIHPLDYERFRLNKDGNGQYYGGGYFQGQYGNGGMLENPPLWGLRTVVTTVATQGEVLVGNFRLGATVYRKGGVRVEGTNSHADNFTENKVTVRAEERVALAVRYPAAFVKVALAPAA